MPTFIKSPSNIKYTGNKPKTIEEFVGRVNSNTDKVSVARMKSTSGWCEPGQKPGFDEYMIVLSGMLQVKTKDDVFDVKAGEAIIIHAGEWVQYSTPGPDGAEYIAVCIPAYSPDLVQRDK